MRRLLLVLLIPVLAVLALVGTGAGGDDEAPIYTVELDNAFGLTVGSDFKVAGVRAGTIKAIRLDRETNDALVDIQVDKTGFGDLRTDAFCESRPQSLIGEYYLDCAPGDNPQKLADGDRIPLEQTGSTVPADLLASVMQRPYRERLRIILSQLGVGLAARGEDLNEAIRRASPALRETDRVLSILAEQNTTLRDLITDADTVLAALAGNREDVARWVGEARSLAADSATRREEIAAGLARLPGFLRELRPTMAQLGRTADAQAPALRDLGASADRLELLFNQLGPFSRATQVNLRSLGETAEIGVGAVRSASPVVEELDRFAVDTPELGQNLDIILRDLRDRDRAVEEDPRSPGGKGYTGFEALLQYVYDQTMAVNIYDANTHLLKVALFESECSEYQNAESLRKHEAEHPGFIERCAAWLGPNQLGVLQPDPTETETETATRATESDGKRRRNDASATPTPDAGVPDVPVQAVPTSEPGVEATPEALVPLLGDTLEQLPEVDLPGRPNTNNPEDLLDFLLTP
jgi:virulence factor Mce-like protein